MRRGLQLVIEVVHVVQTIGGMQGRVLRQGMTSAQVIAAGCCVTAAAAHPAAAAVVPGCAAN